MEALGISSTLAWCAIDRTGHTASEELLIQIGLVSLMDSSKMDYSMDIQDLFINLVTMFNMNIQMVME